MGPWRGLYGAHRHATRSVRNLLRLSSKSKYSRDASLVPLPPLRQWITRISGIAFPLHLHRKEMYSRDQTSCEDARRTYCNFLYGNCGRRSGSRGNTNGDLYVVTNGESEETRSEEAMKKGGRTSWQRRAPWSTRAQSSAITRLHGLLLQPRGDSASPSSRGEM